MFAFTGAKLASDIMTFEQAGKIQDEFVKFKLMEPKIDKDFMVGTVVVLDSIYGNLWTNIDTAKKGNFVVGTSALLEVYNANKLIYSSKTKFVEAFGEVKVNTPLIYINSTGNLAMALNQGNFARKFNIKPGYTVKLESLM